MIDSFWWERLPKEIEVDLEVLSDKKKIK